MSFSEDIAHNARAFIGKTAIHAFAVVKTIFSKLKVSFSSTVSGPTGTAVSSFACPEQAPPPANEEARFQPRHTPSLIVDDASPSLPCSNQDTTPSSSVPCTEDVSLDSAVCHVPNPISTSDRRNAPCTPEESIRKMDTDDEAQEDTYHHQLSSASVQHSHPNRDLENDMLFDDESDDVSSTPRRGRAKQTNNTGPSRCSSMPSWYSDLVRAIVESPDVDLSSLVTLLGCEGLGTANVYKALCSKCGLQTTYRRKQELFDRLKHFCDQRVPSVKIQQSAAHLSAQVAPQPAPTTSSNSEMGIAATLSPSQPLTPNQQRKRSQNPKKSPRVTSSLLTASEEGSPLSPRMSPGPPPPKKRRLLPLDDN
jgi:hypothetical protein